VSGAVLAAASSESARRRQTPAEIALLLGLARVAVALVVAGTVLVLAFGLWLVELAGGFHAWSIAALVLFAATAALGVAGGRRPRAARVLAQNGGSPADVHRLLDDAWSRTANYASGVLVLAILSLMVWQP
jgi:rhodanese-related sulfurtransferase